jgi:hypothetical protein
MLTQMADEDWEVALAAFDGPAGVHRPPGCLEHRLEQLDDETSLATAVTRGSILI